jgi:hypothetical protein
MAEHQNASEICYPDGATGSDDGDEGTVSHYASRCGMLKYGAAFPKWRGVVAVL